MKEVISNEYGMRGKPTFICSANFDKEIEAKISDTVIRTKEPIIFESKSEPCGIHQADIWCIKNGNVCPYLIMGIEPINKSSKEKK